jgi:hypothetical protein
MALVHALPVLLLLLCPAGALATPAAAPSPATGLQAEEVCLGIGTNSKSLACLANLSASCLAASAVTEEATYLACFIPAILTGQQCLAGPPRAAKGCIGIDVSDERVICLGLAGWTCQGSSFGHAGFIACYLVASIKHCLL